MNHPSYYLLKFISEQIVLLLSLKNINYKFYEIDNCKCIIYKCIQKVIKFNINECKLKIQDSNNGEIKDTIEDITKLYYDIYDRVGFC